MIFICWKLLYHLILYPNQFPDKQLTYTTAACVGFLYEKIWQKDIEPQFLPITSDGMTRTSVIVNGRPVINVADGCNALELYIVYIGFVLCLQSKIKDKLRYITIGLVSIFFLNILRCLALLWLKDINNDFFYFAHHYLFYMVVYSFIFFLWFLYVKNIRIAA